MVESIKTKQDSFAKSIMEAIRCGLYPVGRKLPSERALCARYSLSRNTVREGLANLFAEGILTRHGYGAVVSQEALRLIESGRNLKRGRVFVMISFNQYENPIFRGIFERLRFGLEGYAECIVVFYDSLEDAIPSDLTDSDIAMLLGNSESLPALHSHCANVIHMNGLDDASFCIIPDNYGAGREVASFLYGLGHREIGIALCKPNQHGEFGDRFRGIRDYFAEVGVKMHVAKVKDVSSELKWMDEFVQCYRNEGVTAIICVKDESALTLYECARKSGIAIPDDMGVVGFDDRCYAANVRPALTTVRYPVERMADAAVDCVRQLLHGETPERIQYIPMVLLKRESVKQLAMSNEQ